MTSLGSAPPGPSSDSAPTSSQDEEARRFAAAAEEGNADGLLAEFVAFLRHNKKWWLTPILLALVLLAGLILLGGSPLAPFIYPLF
jgi:hypothetical protein